MRSIARVFAMLCYLATLGLSLSLWSATGQSILTKIPDEDLAKMRTPSGGDDVFAGLGMNDKSGVPAAVDNLFRFGLLPAGPGHMFADSASVLTIAGPALVLFGLSMCRGCRRRGAKAAT